MTTRFTELRVDDMTFGKLEETPTFLGKESLGFLKAAVELDFWYKHRSLSPRPMGSQTKDRITPTTGLAPSTKCLCATSDTPTQTKSTTNRSRPFTISSKRSMPCAAARSSGSRSSATKAASKYEYVPIARQRADENNDDEEMVLDKAAPYRPPYLKIKIDIDYKTNRPTPRLFDRSNGDRVEVKPETFAELTDHMRFMTKHRLVIHLCRLYCMKSAAGNEKRPYGIILKLAAAECTNKKSDRAGSSLDVFIDEDD